jgi:hypothetical protein
MVQPYVFQLFEQEEEDFLFARQKRNGVPLMR